MFLSLLTLLIERRGTGVPFIMQVQSPLTQKRNIHRLIDRQKKNYR